MLQQKPLPFTPEGKHELALEIALLERVREEILSESRGASGREAEALRKELEAVNDQMVRLQHAVDTGELVEDTSYVVAVGSEVRVAAEYGEATFTIGGPIAATPRRGCISYESPLGRALLGAQPGDQVEPPSDNGPRRITILSVKRGRPGAETNTER